MSYVDRATTDFGGYQSKKVAVTDSEATVGVSSGNPADFPVALTDDSCRIIKLFSGTTAVLDYESNVTQVLPRSEVVGTTLRNIAQTYDSAATALALCFAGQYDTALPILQELAALGAPIVKAVHALSGVTASNVGNTDTNQSLSNRNALSFNFFKPTQYAGLLDFNFGSGLTSYNGADIDYKATAMTAYALGFYSHWNDGLEDDCAAFGDALINYGIPADIETAVLSYYGLMWTYAAVNDLKYRDAARQVAESISAMTPAGMRETAFHTHFLISDERIYTDQLNSMLAMSGNAGDTFIAATCFARANKVSSWSALLSRYPRLTSGHYSNNTVDTAWHIAAMQYKMAFELLSRPAGMSASGSAMGMTRNKSLQMGASRGGSPMEATRNKVIQLGLS